VNGAEDRATVYRMGGRTDFHRPTPTLFPGGPGEKAFRIPAAHLMAIALESSL